MHRDGTAILAIYWPSNRRLPAGGNVVIPKNQRATSEHQSGQQDIMYMRMPMGVGDSARYMNEGCNMLSFSSSGVLSPRFRASGLIHGSKSRIDYGGTKLTEIK